MGGARISAEQRSLAICLRVNGKKYFRDIARHCGIFVTTAIRVYKKDFLLREKEMKDRAASKDKKKKMGRPRMASEEDMRALV